MAEFFDRCIPEPNSGCWLWMGTLHRSGYGKAHMLGTGRKNRKHITAHRMSWNIHCDTPADGMDILHRCDTPSCVNPDHLFLGTQADNVADMIRKGRAVNLRGEKHGNARLTDRKVLEIRDLHARGVSVSELEARFGIGETTVRRVVHRKSWKHLP